MSPVLAVLIGLPLLGVLAWRLWGLRSGSRGLQSPPEEAVPASLTITGVSPDRFPAGDAEAFCMISGFLTGPDLTPTEVYRRMIVPVDGHWPQVGEELHVRYLPGRARTHWWLDPAAG